MKPLCIFNIALVFNIITLHLHIKWAKYEFIDLVLSICHAAALATRHEGYYDCCPEPYIDIRFTIHIMRRSFHLRLEIFLPPALLAVIALASFGLPVTSGERITLGIKFHIGIYQLSLM